MPSKEKRKDKKNKKRSKRLSTEDILKIIKKLKPKTQQIVKVNIGDKGSKDSSKKQPGQVQTSYNPPFVLPANQQAITTIGQPPFQPPLMAVSKTAPSWSYQPEKLSRPLIDPELLPPPPSLRRSISNESAYSALSEEKVEKPYKVRAPRTTKTSKKAGLVAEDVTETETESEYFVIEPSSRKFTQPKSFFTSTLSASSAVPSYFNLPAQNDKYQADIINTDNSGDQIGTIANSLSSSEWTGSPQGDIAPAATPDVPDVPVPLSLTESELELPIVTEETFSMDKPPEDIFIAPELKPPKEPIPPIPETKKLKAAKSLPPVVPKKTIADSVAEINAAIDQGYLKNLDWIPYKFTIKKGIDTGKLTSKITKDELNPIYAAFRAAMEEK